MNTPKEAEIDSSPSDDSGTTASTAAVIIKWKGVSDSDRLEVQFLEDQAPVYSSYTEITAGEWSAATSIQVVARPNVDDNYIYTLQTTLQPDTYYWWRIKNYRSKLNMFGNNLETYTSTQPKVFKTGEFSGGGFDEGEIPSTPTPPDGRGDFELQG